MTYIEEINALCLKYDINITYSKLLDNEDWAYSFYSILDPKIINISPDIDNARLYIFALHEIGHIVIGYQPISEELLKIEAEAWLFVLEYTASIGFSLKDSRADIAWAINTYWRLKQLEDFGGSHSEEWELFIDLMGLEYNLATNKWNLKEEWYGI